MAHIMELGRAPGFRIGALGSTLITVFHETATMDRLDLLERVQTKRLETHSPLFALNIVVGSSVKSPPADVRDRAAKLQARFDSTTVAAVTVLDVKGLAAAIARGFMAALALVSSGSKPTQVFKNVADAVAWLNTLPGAPPELQELNLQELSDFADDVMSRAA